MRHTLPFLRIFEVVASPTHGTAACSILQSSTLTCCLIAYGRYSSHRLYSKVRRSTFSVSLIGTDQCLGRAGTLMWLTSRWCSLLFTVCRLPALPYWRRWVSMPRPNCGPTHISPGDGRVLSNRPPRPSIHLTTRMSASRTENGSSELEPDPDPDALYPILS